MSVLDTHRRFHFVGVGGAGMSALAEVLLDRGYEVSGCDQRPGAATERLAGLGARIDPGHDPAHLGPADAVVVTAAVPRDLPEVAAARARGQTVLRRAELLAAILGRGQGIAIAGTHGKSTTTSMVGSILTAAGWDPTVLVGGRIRTEAGNVRLGSDRWLVAEADEFDRSFLVLDPAHAVITNVEADHLDTYGTADAVAAAFAEFAARVTPGGTLALGIDDPGARGLPRPGGRRVVGFGLDPTAQVRGEGIERAALETRFELRLGDAAPIATRLQLPGRHNVLNALGAAALAWSLGIDGETIREGLDAVRGVERRFELLHEGPEVLVVDDYAHHPTEIAATLASARSGWPDRRLVAVFQPHLYSRTRDFAGAFGIALAAADAVVVTDVYPAREAPIAGVTGELVARAARAAGARDVTYLPTGTDVARAVGARVVAGDLVLTMGAGDIDAVARQLAAGRSVGGGAASAGENGRAGG